MPSQPTLPTPDPWKVDLGDRTSKLPKVKLAETPSPIVVRAEQLCDLVDAADGIRPDRSELIAALIFDASPDGKKLASVWQKYRTAPVHQVLLDQTSTSGPVDLNTFKRR